MSVLEENQYIKLNNEIEQLKQENKHIKDMLNDLNILFINNINTCNENFNALLKKIKIENL